MKEGAAGCLLASWRLIESSLPRRHCGKVGVFDYGPEGVKIDSEAMSNDCVPVVMTSDEQRDKGAVRFLQWVTVAVLTSSTLAAVGVFPRHESHRKDIEISQLRDREWIQIALYSDISERLNDGESEGDHKLILEEMRHEYNAVVGDKLRFERLADYLGKPLYENFREHSTKSRVRSAAMSGAIPAHLAFPDWEALGESGFTVPKVELVKDPPRVFSPKVFAVTIVIAGASAFLLHALFRMRRPRVPSDKASEARVADPAS